MLIDFIVRIGADDYVVCSRKPCRDFHISVLKIAFFHTERSCVHKVCEMEVYFRIEDRIS